MQKKDLKVKYVVIGGGSAGVRAANEIAKITDDYILINGGYWGTTCARVGCMPSKLLIQSANDYFRRNHFENLGIEGAKNLKINLKKVLERVREYRDNFVKKTIKSTSKFKKYDGYAKFIEPYVIDVEGKIIRAEKIVIAVGSSPILPEKWKNLGDGVITTDQIFEQEIFEKNFATIGAGIIGLELGQALNRLEIENTVYEATQNIAGITDPKILDFAKNIFIKEFDIKLNNKIDLDKKNNKIIIKDGNDIINKDQVLIAIGRKSNIKYLNLNSVGIKTNEFTGIPDFDPHTMKLNDHDIYIAGDCSGFRPLLHEAADEGIIAGYNAARNDITKFKRKVKLSIAFTEPNIAIIGNSYKDIIDQNPVIGEFNFKEQGRAKVMDDNIGMIRIYIDRQNGMILGSEMACPRAENMAHLLVLAIEQKLTVYDMIQMPFYHPVLEEGLRGALRNAISKIKLDNPNLEIKKL